VTQSCAAGLDGLALAQALRQLQSEILRLQEPA
jgi:hypothetical protein